jgi:cytochrome P450
MSNPDAWAAIKADPALIPGAVEETLRTAGSIFSWRRTAEVDTEINGVAIPKGSQILVLMGSANRDPQMFEKPNTFDITRENARQHLSFGFGIHYCIGNMLGKLQTKVALEELVKNVPTMQFAPGTDIEFGDNLSFRVPVAVPVIW